MMRLTPVVKNLIIINVIVFFAVNLLGAGSGIRQYFVLQPFGSGLFSPIQLITHMFSHWDLNHLFFNMLGLFFLGPMLEQTVGEKRLLSLYFLAGAGAVILHTLMAGGSPVLGASGCLLGVYVAFAMYHPNMEMMLMFIPIPIKAKYLIGAFVLGDVFLGFGGAGDGIAHFAHLGGAIVGFLLVLAWRKYPNLMR